MLGRKFDMPYGPGTYGSKVGRPPKKFKTGGDTKAGAYQFLADQATDKVTEPMTGMGDRVLNENAPAVRKTIKKLGLEGETYSVPKYEREDKVRKPKKKKKKTKKMNAGGKVGRGYGKARGAKACKYVSMKGS
jgi:hypothetical protein